MQTLNGQAVMRELEKITKNQEYFMSQLHQQQHLLNTLLQQQQSAGHLTVDHQHQQQAQRGEHPDTFHARAVSISPNLGTSHFLDRSLRKEADAAERGGNFRSAQGEAFRALPHVPPFCNAPTLPRGESTQLNSRSDHNSSVILSAVLPRALSRIPLPRDNALDSRNMGQGTNLESECSRSEPETAPTNEAPSCEPALGVNSILHHHASEVGQA